VGQHDRDASSLIVPRKPHLTIQTKASALLSDYVTQRQILENCFPDFIAFKENNLDCAMFSQIVRDGGRKSRHAD
jgi:hypothetical protein